MPAPEAFSREAPFRSADSPEAVFGRHTQRTAGTPESRPPQVVRQDTSANELALNGMAVLLFLLFSFLVFRHRPSVRLLFHSLAAKGQFTQLITEQSVSFRLFIREARLVGFLALLTVSFRCGLIWSDLPAWGFPENAEDFLLPLLAAVLLATLLYKRILLWIVAVLSRKDNRVECIRAFNKTWFTITTLILSPAILCCVLANPEEQKIAFAVFFILLTFSALYYLIKSFSFFVSLKISILQWILYLCAVEIWPISFFVLFVRRGFEW